jgi:hypothetical protein
MAITLEYIPLTAAEIPVEKVVEFGGVNYRLRFLWNEIGEFYTLTFYTADGAEIYAVKLVYGFNVIRATIAGFRIAAKIVLADAADFVSEIPVKEEILKEDLGQSVLVYVFRD